MPRQEIFPLYFDISETGKSVIINGTALIAANATFLEIPVKPFGNDKTLKMHSMLKYFYCMHYQLKRCAYF